MVSTDPIADMLTRVRNALAVHKEEVNLPHSKIKEAVARLMMANKYIAGVKVVDGATAKTLQLKLISDGVASNITEIKRMSTPGRRMYATADKIPMVKQGRGIVIVSTSKGLMTGRQARRERLGGELICKIY
jgi:small subunit ribosomal protein S8